MAEISEVISRNEDGWFAIQHKDGWWAGDEEGVTCYKDKETAKVGLTILNGMTSKKSDSGNLLYRTKPFEYKIEKFYCDETLHHAGDEDTNLSGLEVLQVMEDSVKRNEHRQ